MAGYGIHALEISNIRGIKHGKIDGFADINILVGKNGSGKSTILESLYLWSVLVSHSEDRRRWFSQNLSVAKWLSNRRQLGSLMGESSASFAYGNPNLAIHTIIDIFKKEDNTVQPFDYYNVDRDRLYLNGLTAKKISNRLGNDVALLPLDFVDSLDSMCSVDVGGITVAYAMKGRDDRIYFKYSDHPGEVSVENIISDWVNLDGDAKETISIPDVDLFDAHVLTRRVLDQRLWNRVLRRKRKNDLLKKFNSCYDYEIESIDWDPMSGGIVVAPEDVDRAFPVDQLGAGMRMGLRLLMAAISVEHGVLLVEEVDAYQHPESLDAIFKALVGVAAQNGIQLILSTHRARSMASLVSETLDAGLDGRVIPMALDLETGELETRSVPFEVASGLLESGYDFRFFADYIEE